MNASTSTIFRTLVARVLLALGILAGISAQSQAQSNITNTDESTIPAFTRAHSQKSSKDVALTASHYFSNAAPAPTVLMPVAGWAAKPIGGRNYVGAEVGLSYNWLAGADKWYMIASVDQPALFNPGIVLKFASGGSGIGWQFGGVADYALSNSVSLQGKLRYISSSTSATDTRTEPVSNFDTTGASQTLNARIISTYNATWNNLGLDLLGRFQLSPDSYYLLGGFGFSALLSNSLAMTQKIDSADPSVSYLDFRTGAGGLSGVTSINVASQSVSFWNSTRFDVKVGAGTFIPVGDNGMVVTPELLLSVPLTDLFDKSNTDAYASQGVTPPKLWSISLSVGVKWPWGGESSAEPAAYYNGSTTPSPSKSFVSEENPAHLKGTVTDKKTGAPLEAKLTVTDLSDNSVIATTKTSNGDYDVPVTKAGRYSVTADADNHLFGSAYFEVDPSGRILKGKHDIILSEAGTGRTRLLVFFDFGKDELQRSSYPELDRAVNLMQANPSMRVEIAGYTDNIGTAAYNKDLAMRRAKSVRDYLVSKGVATTRVMPQGYGADDPIAPNDTDDGRAENRRVEFVVTNK